MYSDGFLKIVKAYDQKIKNIDSNSKEYILELNYFLKNIQNYDPVSFDLFLDKYGINNDFSIWKKQSLVLLENVTSYGVIGSKIRIEQENDVLEGDLISIFNYISSKKIPKDSWENTLAIAFMIEPSNFEFYQIINLILKD